MSLQPREQAAPLVSLAVYCPLLCQDKEEKAQDNILFFSPPQANVNRQMNLVGFCIAMSSLAPRFGVLHSTRQTIRKQRSSVCLYSPVADLWASAHVRGGYGEAETTHQLLQLSFALFELLYGPTVLYQLARLPSGNQEEESTTNAPPAASSSDANELAEARDVLRSFFSKCADFFSEVLAAQQGALAGTAAPLSFQPSPSMTTLQWARYLCAEATLGFPLHYVNPHELPRRQMGNVEDTVQQVLWPRAWTQVDAVHSPDELPRYCLFCLPSLYVLQADSRLSCRELQALKYYCVLYAPITSSSFVCHLPGEAGPCDVAVWLEGNILVVLMEPQHARAQPAEAMQEDDAAASSAPRLPPPLVATTPSLLQSASAIGAKVRQLLTRSAAGYTTPVERDTYWIATGDAARHDAQYTTASLSKLSAALADSLVLRLRLVGGVVEGTSLMKVWPGLVERVRAIVTSTRTAIAASPSAEAAWESWTRWGPIWICLRIAGPTVAVLAWRSPANIRQLFCTAKRTLLLHA